MRKYSMISMDENAKVWYNGKLVAYGESKVPILTHSLQYGTGIFEGIRAYETKDGAAIFRLEEHMKRFLRTAHIYSYDIGYSLEELMDAVKSVVKENNLKSCYIRPFAFVDDDRINLVTQGKKISTFVAALPFTTLFEKADKGISCKVSSWRRLNSDVLPIQAKASGNYINSIAADLDAHASGFDEAILLSMNGFVAEGAGENIFLVEDGEIVTPSKESDILIGITRDAIIRIAKSMGFTVTERFVHRDELYYADEIFFAGTAAEVTPIVKVDGVQVGKGEVGEITSKIRETFFKVVKGENPQFKDWLTKV